MRFSKLGALGAATAMAATGLALPFAQSAGAALKPSVVCSKIAAKTTLHPDNTGTTATTWMNCTPTALKAGGTSSVTVPVSDLLGTLKSTIKWKNGKGTTKVTLTYKTQSTKTGCPAGTLYRTKITGKTGVSTGAAAKVVKKGEPITAEVCTKQATPNSYSSTLKPGTKFKI